MPMKFLLDMNLSPDWLSEFETHSLEAVHWSQIGEIDAPDEVIMHHARQRGFTVFNCDLDFGALLATTSAVKPSVIQLRAQKRSPKTLASRVFATIERYKDELEEGALIVVDANKERMRPLPM